MASKQVIAYGASVERSTDGGTTWEDIPECKGIAIPTVETDYHDVTSLDSANGFKEYIKGMKDAGVFSVPCGYTADGYAQQLADQALTAPVQYKTTLPLATGQTSGDVFEFSGFPTPQVEPGSDVNTPIEMSISIRTTGAVTWTQGATS